MPNHKSEVNVGKGYYLCIGVKRPSKDHYSKDTDVLPAPHNDARAFRALADKAGFQPLDSKRPMLLGHHATLRNVMGILKRAPRRIRPQDVLLLFFSGHGGGYIANQLPGGHEQKNETWCLYDTQLFDVELGELWTKFSPMTRILVVSDSCNSGTVVTVPFGPATLGRRSSRRIKSLRKAARQAALQNGYSDYKRRLDQAMRRDEATRLTKAQVLLLAACEEIGDAFDATRTAFPLSLFTQNLLDVWGDADFQGTYDDLIDAVSRRVMFVESDQKPQIFEPKRIGAFRLQRPFST